MTFYRYLSAPDKCKEKGDSLNQTVLYSPDLKLKPFVTHVCSAYELKILKIYWEKEERKEKSDNLDGLKKCDRLETLQVFKHGQPWYEFAC